MFLLPMFHHHKESLVDVMATIATTLKARLCPDDIDTIHRVPTKKNNQENIVVKFISRTKRDEVLQRARKQRLLASTVGYESNEPVYVNEHLCPENKVLLGKAVQKKRDELEICLGLPRQNPDEEDREFSGSARSD